MGRGPLVYEMDKLTLSSPSWVYVRACVRRTEGSKGTMEVQVTFCHIHGTWPHQW